MNKIITTEFERISVEKMLNIDSKYRKYWIVSDRDVDAEKHVVIFSYIGKGETMAEQTISKYRGYILDIKNNVIISKSFGMPEQIHPDYFVNERRSWDNKLIYQGKEGVSIRIFFYKNTLYMATHRKLQFHHSIFRPTITFSEMFNSFCDSENTLERIKTYCQQSQNIVFVYMVHSYLAIADTNNQQFGLYFFCIQDTKQNFKNHFEYPEWLNGSCLLKQEPLTFEQATTLLSGEDLYDRSASSILIVEQERTLCCMSRAFEFRKTILGEEQTLYPSFVKRVFELRITSNKNYQGTAGGFNNTEFYQRTRPMDMSYADFIYAVYRDICPDSIKHMLIVDNGYTLAEKYSLDSRNAVNFIRTNPDAIIEHSKETRISVFLAKLRKTQNFLKLEEYINKNCNAEQFYSIITDYKRAKHMLEKQAEAEKTA